MKEFYRRHLPHWQPRNAVFFITFRLKNSLPSEEIEAMKQEREREKIVLQLSPELERTQQIRLEQRRYFDKWDDYLDKAEFGPRWLAQPEIAEIVKESLLHRDAKVYDLHAFCIMSNHVHVVFEPLSRSEWYSDFSGSERQSDLPKIMQSLKRHTARQSNLILNKEGAFWQDESYDHVIRDSEEYIRIIQYILENPVKAGLASKWDEWPWTYHKPCIL